MLYPRRLLLVALLGCSAGCSLFLGDGEAGGDDSEVAGLFGDVASVSDNTDALDLELDVRVGDMLVIGLVVSQTPAAIPVSLEVNGEALEPAGSDPGSVESLLYVSPASSEAIAISARFDDSRVASLGAIAVTGAAAAEPLLKPEHSDGFTDSLDFTIGAPPNAPIVCSIRGLGDADVKQGLERWREELTIANNVVALGVVSAGPDSQLTVSGIRSWGSLCVVLE